MLNIYNYINETGTITPDALEVQTFVENLFKAIFGENLNIDSSTPQGMLIQAFTLLLIGLTENDATLANQINRNIAGGIFLDADAALFGIQRIAGTPSLVYATVTGVAGTIISANSQAKETVNGALFATVDQVTIPAEGSLANVQFKSWTNLTNPPGFLNGAIPCAAGTLTQIVSTIPGWESVTNPDSAILGTLQQSDVNFRNTINQSLSNQSIGALGSITAKIITTPGVNSTYPLENNLGTTEVIQGVSMVSHSIYYCIDYTCSDADIANAFTRSKNEGSNYNNGPGINKSYPYTAPISGQVINVLWDYPSLLTIQMQITISALTSLQDPTTSVQNAVIAYANGEVPLMPGFTVGTSVSPSQIAAAIAQQVPGIFVEEVQIALIKFTKQGTLTNTSNHITSMSYVNGTSYADNIANGMTVTGTGIPSSTTVTNADLSDTSIQISNNATVSGIEVLTFSQAAVYQTTSIPIQPWQKAITSTSFITVIEL